jgi:hypothetical protein
LLSGWPLRESDLDPDHDRGVAAARRLDVLASGDAGAGAAVDDQCGACPARVVTVALWLGAAAGGGGVVAGLVAVRRGAQPSVRLLLAAGLVAVAALAVLPPAGSTDPPDYAAYGRIMVLGRSPYVMTRTTCTSWTGRSAGPCR